ncbi:MAG: DUF4974 domain-containing protein [Odoribacteraceae bacterium]|nr:DUF4974 domain-containing protein [Odoribacteraceae bacterium]
MKDNDDIISKIVTYISGELDDEERNATKRWIDADADRRALFEQVQREEQRLRWSVRVALIKGTYAQVRNRLRRHVVVRWGGIAAAAIAVGIFATLYAPVRERGNVSTTATADSILPGKPRAMLYLASGEGIAVTDSARTILDPGVAEVDVKAGGELTYTTGAPALPGAMHRVTIPRGGEFSAVLSDGTKIWLNSRTELSYPVTFSGNSREVHLDGEAYFEVAADGRPFVVHAGDVVVRVLGTDFNINTQTAGVVKTVLVRGSVEVIAGGERVKLAPDQLATYRASDGTLSARRVDVTPYVAWKDDNFVFDGQRLEDIMETLSLWYDVEVIYENDAVKETRLTGDLERYDDVRKLLYFFEKTSSGLHFEIDGKKILVQWTDDRDPTKQNNK